MIVLRDNVRLNYNRYPEELENGIVKVDEEKDLKLSLNRDKNGILVEIREDIFGTENKLCVNLDFEMAQDVYRLMYLLIRQLDRIQKENPSG